MWDRGRVVELLGHCTGNLVVPDLSPSPCLLLGLFSVALSSIPWPPWLHLVHNHLVCFCPVGILKLFVYFKMFNLFVVALKSPTGGVEDNVITIIVIVSFLLNLVNKELTWITICWHQNKTKQKKKQVRLISMTFKVFFSFAHLSQFYR